MAWVRAIVGTPAKVADKLEEYIELSDCDGFNIAYSVFPQSYVDIVEMLVPELQRRGIYKHDYTAGTLREKLYKKQPRLAANHPASAYRKIRPETVDVAPQACFLRHPAASTTKRRQELLAALETRQMSAVELVDASISRIESLDGDINAVVERDFERGTRRGEGR